MSALNGTGRVEPAKAPTPGLLHPLRHTGFALIAGATLVSNVGVWMRDTTSVWTVAGAAHNHSAVVLVQAATALPTFLLALPAGVLADHFDRRRLLILCQLGLAAVGAALAVLSYAHALTVEMIVVLAFLAGPAAAYACNVAAYGATILALLLVRAASEPPAARVPMVFWAELHQGFAFVGQSAGLRRILLRGSALFLCALCYLALTPLIAHDLMGSRPDVYGLLLAATGIGSVMGGAVLSKAKKQGTTDDALLVACSAAGAAALLTPSQAHEPALAGFALAVAGGSTLIQLATFNGAAQLMLPEAIRGRGLAIYMAATFGCMAVGSLLWGAVSDVFSIGAALAVGALGFALTALVGWTSPLAAASGTAPAGTAS